MQIPFKSKFFQPNTPTLQHAMLFPHSSSTPSFRLAHTVDFTPGGETNAGFSTAWRDIRRVGFFTFLGMKYSDQTALKKLSGSISKLKDRILVMAFKLSRSAAVSEGSSGRSWAIDRMVMARP